MPHGYNATCHMEKGFQFIMHEISMLQCMYMHEILDIHLHRVGYRSEGSYAKESRLIS